MTRSPSGAQKRRPSPALVLLLPAALLVACGGEGSSGEDANLASKAAQAKLVTAHGDLDENGLPFSWVSLGLDDSSFNYGASAPELTRTAICFEGAASKVCAAVDKEAKAKQKRYSRGDH